MTKARNLRIGDVFSIVACGQVLATTPIADGKRMLIKLLLREQKSALEFTDAGCVVEFICLPWREFTASPWRGDDDGDGGDESEPATDPDPTGPVLVDVDSGR
jgi:hypothetical protein